MNIKLIPLLAAVLLANLSACSYVKSLFPDKEKDYQYTTEIPPLIYPKDLAKGDVLNLPPASPSQDMDATGSVQAEPNPVLPVIAKTSEPAELAALPDASVANTTAQELARQDANQENTNALPSTVPDRASEKKLPINRTLLTVDVVKTGETNSLRVDSNFDTAWRTINKALSRKSIEVTNRDQPEKLITVRYDAGMGAVKDGSLWDEALFIFSGLPGSDKQYSLKFSEHEQQTDVTVLNEDLQPVADEDSLNLLKLLQDTIKADFAK
jgi:outer membrane protein assembly factor BamC